MAVLAFCCLLVKRNELLLVSNNTQLGNVLVSDRIYYVIHYASQQLERCEMSKLKQTIITRAQAKEQGLKFYFTGKPCDKNGHLSNRYTSVGNCVDCVAKRFVENKSELTEKNKQYVINNKEKVSEKRKEWYVKLEFSGIGCFNG